MPSNTHLPADRARTWNRLPLTVVALVALMIFAVVTPSAAQSDDDDDVAPAPPSIGADVPLTYFGPAPSDVQDELIGPHQLLTAGNVDLDAGTVTLPLYEGQVTGGKSVWYILTDTTDEGNAAALGLNFSPKLNYSAVGKAVRNARLRPDNTLTFSRGTVDFSPDRKVTPAKGDNAFPPAVAEPGAIGDASYSPLVRVSNAGGHIYNAPMMAFDVDESELNYCNGNPDYDKVHDTIVAICPADGTVTLELTSGFSFARPVLYLSTDSNNPVAAALEGITLAPGLDSIQVGGDDSAFSAVERLFAFTNGPTGGDNPQRQGFNSALTDGRGPLNILGGIPTIATDYSPLWDVNLGEWTQEAIDRGYRSRLIEEFQILGFVEEGWVTGPGGEPYGSSGIIVNCPIVFRFL